MDNDYKELKSAFLSLANLVASNTRATIELSVFVARHLSGLSDAERSNILKSVRTSQRAWQHMGAIAEQLKNPKPPSDGKTSGSN